MSYSVIFTREGAEAFEKSLTLSLAAINAIDTKICDIEFVDGIKFTGDVWRFYCNDIVNVNILHDHQFARFYIHVKIGADNEPIYPEICVCIPWNQIYSIISA